MKKVRFDTSYGRLLGVAYTHVFRRLAKHMKDKELPLTPDQFRILTHLWQNDGCSQQELAVLAMRDRANITRVVDILEREEIVERVNHESDGRILSIHLTKYGRALEENATQCAQAAIDDALQGVSKSDLETCMKVLKKTISNLQAGCPSISPEK